ncbi:extracellular solute-binding protein [Cohnella luojiensis]|uniref:Extracellular solute-binding protein n=1 Tax=Cohnella luojiensis TaxID=652876 RepID=A0A4Y8M3I5_9BACL|nr:extracellular solute-binding protein [Cohnella luojiensis]TFE28600.1 extracellular solute-binding protein [Cohnella luojiensis]
MNRKYARFFAIVLALTLFTALISACSKENKPAAESKAAESSGSETTPAESSSASDPAKPDISKKVELVWYLLGDSHADSPKVVEEWNKMLEKDLNTTVKLNFTTWTEWATKYNLLLTTGEKVDMIFASSWADYFKYAKQGAFLDLTDLLPTYAPQTWSTVPEQDWSEAKVDGKIFAVPATYPEFTPNGIVYREDWRKELNLPEVKDLDSIEAYMDGVKKSKSGVTPIGGSAWNEVSTLFKAITGFEAIGGDGNSVVVAKSYDNPRDIVAYPFTTEFADYAKRMKTWASKGFWSSSTLSVETAAGDLIKAGTGAVYWRNPAGAGGFITDLKKTNPEIEVAYFPFTRIQNYAVPNLSINNGMAIPKSSTNPERSLMVLDKLRNDPKYFNLMTYGFEGTHYSLNADGKTYVAPPKGVEVAQDWKKYDIAGWGWRYEPNMLKEEGSWDGFDKLTEEFKAISRPSIFQPVVLDYEPVKAEQAAVNQVFKQYGQPLMMGLVPDVDKALETYRKKLEGAGIDKVVAYVKEQAEAYYTERNIQ